jgi:hypothetical protein
MKKYFTLFVALLISVSTFSQQIIFEATYVKAHDIAAYDEYIEHVFSKVHQQRIDKGLIIGWDVWKVVDNPQEDFTHMLTTIYQVENQKEINEFEPTWGDGLFSRDASLRGKDLRSIREIVGIVKYMGLAQIRKPGVEEVPSYLVMNIIKLKNEKWKSYEDAEINGTKSLSENDLRVGWDFHRRIDDYGTDISHTHVTADWYDSHESFLKSFMGSPSDANKAYQKMLSLRDLKYRVLMKKHMSLR